MRKAVVLSFVLATLVSLFAKVTLAADMFTGTWKSGNCITQLQLVENGIKRAANCTNVHEEYTVKFDGKDYPEKIVQDGEERTGAVSARKIDDYTIEVNLKEHTQTWTASKDGRSELIYEL